MVKQRPDVFAALGDPTRAAIVDRLARSGDATVSAIAAPLPMSVPAVSKHLGILERAGLIERRKQGRVTVCRLRPRPLADASAWLQERRELWERRLDRLAEHLGEDA